MTDTAWGWIYVSAGTTLVGLGGLLATFGWNKITSDDQRRNVIVGIVREVRLNELMVRGAIQQITEWPRQSEGRSFSLALYRTSHVSAALTSGLLKPGSLPDDLLLQSLEDYEGARAARAGGETVTLSRESGVGPRLT